MLSSSLKKEELIREHHLINIYMHFILSCSISLTPTHTPSLCHALSVCLHLLFCILFTVVFVCTPLFHLSLSLSVLFLTLSFRFFCSLLFEIDKQYRIHTHSKQDPKLHVKTVIALHLWHSLFLCSQ